MHMRKSRERATKTPYMKNITKLVRLDKSDAEFLDRESQKRGISEAQFIRDLIRDFRQKELFKRGEW